MFKRLKRVEKSLSFYKPIKPITVLSLYFSVGEIKGQGLMKSNYILQKSMKCIVHFYNPCILGPSKYYMHTERKQSKHTHKKAKQ